MPELPLFEVLECIKPSLTQFESMSLEQTLQKEIDESKKWLIVRMMILPTNEILKKGLN